MNELRNAEMATLDVAFFSNEIKPSFILNRLRLDIIIRPMKMVVANGAQSHTPPAKKLYKMATLDVNGDGDAAPATGPLT